MTSAAPRSVPIRISAARSTSWPRIRSRTWRAFEADRPLCRRTARVPGRSLVLVAVMSATRSPLLAGVVPEGARGGELAQFVADHRLGHVDRDVTATVVDGNGVADHVGDDGGAAGPGLDDLLLPARVEHVDHLGRCSAGGPPA